MQFCDIVFVLHFADIAQQAEHFLGKEEVTGSSPVISSIFCFYNIFAPR